MSSQNEKSDGWTKLASFARGTSTLVSGTYLIGNLYDSVRGCFTSVNIVKMLGNLSWGGFAIGTSIAAGATLGYGYCAYKLNLNYQTTGTDQLQNMNLLDVEKGFGFKEKAALTGAAITNTMEYSAPLAFVPMLSIPDNIRNSRTDTLVGFLALVCGAIASVADIRTYKNNLSSVRFESEEEGRIEKADIWTKISTIFESISAFISDSYWAATIFDALLSFILELLKKELALTTIGISIPSIPFGLIVGILSAIGSSYCVKIINTNHQTNTHSIPQPGMLIQESEDLGALTKGQKILLFGNLLSHVGTYAGPISFTIQLATQRKSTSLANLLTQCGATLFAIVASKADIRTSENNIIEANVKNRTGNQL